MTIATYTDYLDFMTYAHIDSGYTSKDVTHLVTTLQRYGYNGNALTRVNATEIGYIVRRTILGWELTLTQQMHIDRKCAGKGTLLLVQIDSYIAGDEFTFQLMTVIQKT